MIAGGRVVVLLTLVVNEVVGSLVVFTVVPEKGLRIALEAASKSTSAAEIRTDDPDRSRTMCKPSTAMVVLNTENTLIQHTLCDLLMSRPMKILSLSSCHRFEK